MSLYRVAISELPETKQTGGPPQLRSIAWEGHADDDGTAAEKAWAEFDAKHGTTDRPPATVRVIDVFEQYRVPLTGTLESVARRYIVGKHSRDELVAMAEGTESGGPDDGLLAVIFQHSADQSTSEGLKAALRRYFEPS
jgi:hypothetical protein